MFKLHHFGRFVDQTSSRYVDTDSHIITLTEGQLYRVWDTDPLLFLVSKDSYVQYWGDSFEPFNFEIGMKCKLNPDYEYDINENFYKDNKDCVVTVTGFHKSILDFVKYEGKLKYTDTGLLIPMCLMPILDEQAQEVKECVCDSWNLAAFGCRCGYFQWEKEQRAKC